MIKLLSMLFKLGWYLEDFIYFNGMAIAEICLRNCRKNAKRAIAVAQKRTLKKPEARSKNKEGKLVSIS
jgi:hypothetical protein